MLSAKTVANRWPLHREGPFSCAVFLARGPARIHYRKLTTVHSAKCIGIPAHPELNSSKLQVAFILQPDFEIPRNYALELLSYCLTARQDVRPAGKCSKSETAPQPAIQSSAGRHKEDP